eukprot:3795836-Amphidinium_carterae.1
MAILVHQEILTKPASKAAGSNEPMEEIPVIPIPDDPVQPVAAAEPIEPPAEAEEIHVEPVPIELPEPIHPQQPPQVVDPAIQPTQGNFAAVTSDDQ